MKHLLSSGTGWLSKGPFTPLAVQLDVCRANGLQPEHYYIVVMYLSQDETSCQIYAHSQYPQPCEISHFIKILLRNTSKWVFTIHLLKNAEDNLSQPFKWRAPGPEMMILSPDFLWSIFSLAFLVPHFYNSSPRLPSLSMQPPDHVQFPTCSP